MLRGVHRTGREGTVGGARVEEGRFGIPVLVADIAMVWERGRIAILRRVVCCAGHYLSLPVVDGESLVVHAESSEGVRGRRGDWVG